MINCLPFTIHNAFTLYRLPLKTDHGKRTENGQQKTENGR